MAREKSISKNSFFYLIYNILNIAFPLITGIYVARVLLSKDIGEVESAKNLATYFVVLSFLGIPTYGLREIAKARNNQNSLNKIYSELMTINAISTAIFIASYFVLILSVTTYRNNIVLYSITGISIGLNFLNNSWLFEGLEEFGFITLRNFAFKVLSFILLIVFVRKPDDYLFYALITIIGTGGNYLFNVIQSRKYVRFSIKNLNLKRHMKSIMFLVLVNLAIEIYTLVDITMLRLLNGPEQVAYYSYGSKIYKILIQVISTFTVVIVPRLSYLYSQKKQNEFNELISKTLSIICLVAIPCIIGIYFTSDKLITLVYGEDYYRSSAVLKILSFCTLINPIGYLLGSRVLLVIGQEKKMIIPVTIGAITNVIANYLLIKSMGEKGAAIATLLSEIVVASIYVLLSHKHFRLNKVFSISIAKIIASSTLMTLLLLLYNFLAETSVIKVVFMSILIYFSSLILLKENFVVSRMDKMLNKL